MPTVLVTGGSGYVGSHLVAQLLKDGHRIGFTYLSHEVPPSGGFGHGARGFRVDFESSDGLAGAFQALGEVDVVVNCAALSSPAMCEQDPSYARAVNVPDKLISEMARQKRTRHVDALLIHISSDQVFDGGRANYSETDRCAPVNAFGRSKLEAEQYVRTHWERRIILRLPSLVYGPAGPISVGKPPAFLPAAEAALREGRALRLPADEHRSPIYVKDVCAVVSYLAKLAPGKEPPHHMYNLGGNERLSPADVAAALAREIGADPALVEAAKHDADEDIREYNNPHDTSMHVERIQTEIPVPITSLGDAVREIFAPPPPPPAKAGAARLLASSGGGGAAAAAGGGGSPPKVAAA